MLEPADDLGTSLEPVAPAATQPPDRRGNIAFSIGSGYIVQALAQLSSMVTRIALARIIVPTQWGVFGEAVLIVGIADGLRELNLTQWAVAHPERRWAELPGMLAVTSLVAVAGLAAALPFLHVLSPDLPLTTAIVAITLLPKTWSLIGETQLNAARRLHRLLAPQLLSTLAFILSAILISAHFRSAWALAVATVIQVGVYNAILIYWSRHELVLGFHFERVWASLWSARYFIGLALAGILFSQVDGLMVGAVAGAAAAGYYLMATWLISRLPNFIEVPLLRQLLPVFADHRDDRRQLGDIFVRSAMAINFIEAPWCFLLMFNATFIVQHLLGPNWGAAITLVVLTAAYPLISPLGTVGWEVLRMTGHARLVLGGLILSSSTFLAVGIFLGLRIGVTGVVYGFYLGTLVNGVVMFALAPVIGWSRVLEVLARVVLLYLGCIVPLWAIGALHLAPLTTFLVDAAVVGAIGLGGVLPFLSAARRMALEGRR
jgi:O-antigen/teichoic acid export membrane protein